MLRSRRKKIWNRWSDGLAAAVLITAGTAWAQTGSVSGVAKDAATGAPLSGVMVNAGGAGASTGPEGQFALAGIEPGRQWLSVHDESRAANGGAYVLITPGHESTGVEVRLKLGGTISGRVFDEHRHPIIGASVILLEQRFESGQLAYEPRQSAHTDSRGAYQLAPVPAERNFVMVAYRATPSNAAKHSPVPVPTFYPNSRYADSAELISILPSEDRRGADFAMPLETTYCAAGSIGATPSPLTITRLLSLTTGWTMPPITAQAADHGEFRVCGLDPGEYLISGPETASAQIVIRDADLQGVHLTPHPPITIVGDVSWDPPPRDPAAASKISMSFWKLDGERRADQSGPSGLLGMIGSGSHIPVPGSFNFGHLSAQDYGMRVLGLPEGCYVKEASYGGADLLREPLRLSEASGDNRLHLVLACDAGSLTARVTDRDGNPVSHLKLYVMPADVASAADLALELQIEEIENGWSGTLQPLPPGRYQVLACAVESDGTAAPILRLWRVRSRAKDVSIGPNEASRITLEISDIE